MCYILAYDVCYERLYYENLYYERLYLSSTKIIRSPRRKGVRLVDVAKLAGVSITTVSHVLNERADSWIGDARVD